MNGKKSLKIALTSIQEGIRQDEFNKELFFYGGKIAIKLGKVEDGRTSISARHLP